MNFTNFLTWCYSLKNDDLGLKMKVLKFLGIQPMHIQIGRLKTEENFGRISTHMGWVEVSIRQKDVFSSCWKRYTDESDNTWNMCKLIYLEKFFFKSLFHWLRWNRVMWYNQLCNLDSVWFLMYITELIYNMVTA